MEKLSDHTSLMNKVIGLSQKVGHWPSTLIENGFNLVWIEPFFPNGDLKDVNPDLIFLSKDELHTLLVECKTGTQYSDERKKDTESQISRYQRLSRDHLCNMLELKDSTKLTYELSFSCNPEMLRHLNGYMLPTLVFSDNNIIKRNIFFNSVLENAFSNEIPIDDYPPTELFPYSEKDPDSIIALNVFWALFKIAFKNEEQDEQLVKINTEQIAEATHPLWRDIGGKKREEIKNKINKILEKYEENELKNFMKKLKLKGDWRITKTTESFRKRCQAIIINLDEGNKGLAGFFNIYDE